MLPGKSNVIIAGSPVTRVEGITRGTGRVARNFSIPVRKNYNIAVSEPQPNICIELASVTSV